MFRELQGAVNLIPPLWTRLINSVLVPFPILASCCPRTLISPSLSPSTQKLHDKVYTIPLFTSSTNHHVPLPPRAHHWGSEESLAPAKFLSLSLVCLRLCQSLCVSLSFHFSVSVPMSLLLSLTHTFSQVVPPAWNTFPFPCLLLFTLSFSLFPPLSSEGFSALTPTLCQLF